MLGLFLYDHLARRRILPGSEGVDLRTHVAGTALEKRYTKGFVYSDAWVDDARLVVLNARDAQEHGATVLTRARCARLERRADHWDATLARADGSTLEVQARAAVNATGPWVDGFLDEATALPARTHPRQVKGSHIVVPKLFDHPFAYIFQGADGRVVFAIPYEGDYTLIGTTEMDYTRRPRDARDRRARGRVPARDGERLLRERPHAQRRRLDFRGTAAAAGRPEGPRHQRHARLCARPRQRRARRCSRSTAASSRPIESLRRTCWTCWRPGWAGHCDTGPRPQPLPGGDMPGADFDAFLARARSAHAWLPVALLHRYARAYGTRPSA